MHFHFESRVPAPLRVIFDFHKCPAGLALLHAGWSQMRVLEYPPEIKIDSQTWIEQKAGGFIPVVLGFRHHVYNPPNSFGEELIHGPFSRFVHVHNFTEVNGETIISDSLDVEWPWQYGGDLVMRRIIAPEIRVMFAKRAEAIVRLWRDGVIQQSAMENQAAGNC